MSRRAGVTGEPSGGLLVLHANANQCGCCGTLWLDVGRACGWVVLRCVRTRRRHAVTRWRRFERGSPAYPCPFHASFQLAVVSNPDSIDRRRACTPAGQGHGDNPPPDIIVDKTAQFVAKVCCASPTTLIRPQQHIHTRQPTLPRKIYFGLTAHPPSATRPQHTQPAQQKWPRKATAV